MNCGEIYTLHENKGQGYSIGWSLKTLIDKGLPKQKPPTTLQDLLEQIITLIINSSVEWIGPHTINSLDSYIADFVEKENLEIHTLRDLFVDFFQKIHEKKLQLTITLDLGYSSDFQNEKRDTYDLINHVLQDISSLFMQKGIFEPYIVVNLYPETDWRISLLDSWLKLSYKYGQPVYHNFITGTIMPETLRPRENKPESENVYLRIGGANGNCEKQTVTGYVCINLAKIATEAHNESHFFELIEEKMVIVSNILIEKHRSIIDRFKKNGMPLTKWFIEDLSWSYSIISLVGTNEALEHVIDAPLGHIAGKAVTYKILESLLRKVEDIQIETGHLFSLESYPSDIPGALLLEEYETHQRFLTTGTELEPSHGSDMWDVLEYQKKFHSLYTGGTLQQIYLEKGPSYNQGLKLLLNRIIQNFGYNYLAITPIFSLCENHGYVLGNQEKCPKCRKKTETYTRIDTKIKPVSGLQPSLKEAFRQRVYYDVKNE
jgi:ribonucleoside-triphosphate reductase